LNSLLRHRATSIVAWHLVSEGAQLTAVARALHVKTANLSLVTFVVGVVTLEYF
jgi:hypothetical protein